MSELLDLSIFDLTVFPGTFASSVEISAKIKLLDLVF